MTGDARFEDGRVLPLRLKALDADDLAVLSSLVQDAVFPASEMIWTRKDRRFAILLNRFRWEDAPNAEQRRRHYERVQSVLAIEDVTKVQSLGVGRSDNSVIMSVLSISFQPGIDGTGHVLLTLAGDGLISVEVETLEVVLRDVTRPYAAASGKLPGHPG